jgi:hypothetical protein
LPPAASEAVRELRLPGVLIIRNDGFSNCQNLFSLLKTL